MSSERSANPRSVSENYPGQTQTQFREEPPPVYLFEQTLQSEPQESVSFESVTSD